MSAPIPFFDDNLIHRTRMLGDGGKVHRLANALAAYESAWDIGQEYGWDEDNGALLKEAELELRKLLT